MQHLPTPALTTIARQWLTMKDAKLDRIQQALLATVDGHRNIIELESVARAMGLAPSTLETMRQEGLIEDTAVGDLPNTARSIRLASSPARNR
jgi:hypothetical protein